MTTPRPLFPQKRPDRYIALSDAAGQQSTLIGYLVDRISAIGAMAGKLAFIPAYHRASSAARAYPRIEPWAQ